MGRTRLALAATTAAVAGLAGGAGGLVLAATPASAASPPPASGPPFVSIGTPAPNTVETNTSTPSVAGTIRGTAPRSQLTVRIFASHDGQAASSYPATATATSSSQTDWNFSGTPNLASNGPYQLWATATENNGPTGTSSAVSMAEGVRPQAPTGVSATKDADGVTVAWQANPEPDIANYVVQRTSVNGSNWSTVGNPPGNNFRDTGVQQGSDYQYQVIAVRPGAQSGSTISSGPSAPASTVAPPAGSLFGPGGSVTQLPLVGQAVTDPVAGLVQPGQGPGRPVTGSPTAGGYSNLPYGGQASLAEPGSSGVQDPKGKPASANIVRTALFVAAALILLAIAAHLIRIRRAVDDTLAPVGVDQWDRHAGGVDEPGQMTTVGSGRGGSDVTRAMPAQRGGAGRSDVTRAMPAQRRR